MSEEKKPKKPWGRSLSDFNNIKEDFAIEGLYPAEHGLVKACARGEMYICPGFDLKWPERPWTIRKELNFIRFEFLRFLILDGDEQTPVDAIGVRLAGAYISDGARGLDIEGHQVPYDIFLIYCHIDGDLNARGASIQTLSLQGCSIQAINADRMTTQGGVFLDQGFEAKGTVRLLNAEIGGDLACVGGTFKAKEFALDLQSAKISNNFQFRDVAECEGILDLTVANISSLVIDAKGWNLPNATILDGCRYQRFSGDISSFDKKFWLEDFLGNQKFNLLPPIMFNPSAHNQLAKILRQTGHEEEALEIHVDRNWRSLKAEKHRLKGLDIPARASLFWRQMLGWTTGFGYRPLRTLWFLVPLFLAGWLAFFTAAERGVMAPSDPLIYVVDGNVKAQSMIVQNCRNNWVSPACSRYLPSEHSNFSPAIYSLDVMLPIINFRQQDDWAPRLKHPYGIWENLGWQVRAWEWLQTVAGWMLSLLLVSGVTGVIRKD